MDRGPWSAGRWLALAALTTMALGVVMRWAMAAGLELPVPFKQVRHAHSHLGYYALLFPLSWLVWVTLGERPPRRWLRWVYGTASVAAAVGFLRAGYGPLAIAGSTVVGLLWVASGWRLRGRLRRWDDPMGSVPVGTTVAMLVVPMVAVTLRRDPVLANALVASFLATMLLLVFVPSALRAGQVSLGPWPLLVGLGLLSAAALGPWPLVVTRAGLLGYGVLLGERVLRSGRLDGPTRGGWLVVAAGSVVLALGGPALLRRDVAVASLHFLVLGPLLVSFAHRFVEGFGARLAAAAIGAAGAMSLAIVAAGYGGGRWASWASALLGTVVLLLWSAVAVRLLRSGR